MYELFLLIGATIVVYRAYNLVDEDQEDLPHRLSERIGKLWDIVHQGMKDNRLIRAEKALLTILKIDEKNTAAYNRLGILYAKQKEYRDAIDCFEIACSIEPTASSLHNLGLIYYETENYDKAVTAFESALKLEDNMAARHIALAKALEHLGNEKLMLTHLERAASIEPSRESLRLLAQGYRRRGEEESAIKIERKLKRMIASPAVKQKKSRFRVSRPRRVVI
jgi:tetratricopeptide (TPR) repeat protein